MAKSNIVFAMNLFGDWFIVNRDDALSVPKNEYETLPDDNRQKRISYQLFIGREPTSGRNDQKAAQLALFITTYCFLTDESFAHQETFRISYSNDTSINHSNRMLPRLVIC